MFNESWQLSMIYEAHFFPPPTEMIQDWHKVDLKG